MAGAAKAAQRDDSESHELGYSRCQLYNFATTSQLPLTLLVNETSDSGHARSDVPRGDEAKTRRSRDGTWAKKGDKSFFGYKFHVEIDTDFGLLRATETTTANVHDSQMDLAKEGEVRYGDRVTSERKQKDMMLQ